MKSLFESTQKVLLSKDIKQKTQGTQKLKQDFEEGKLNHEKAFHIKADSREAWAWNTHGGWLPGFEFEG